MSKIIAVVLLVCVPFIVAGAESSVLYRAQRGNTDYKLVKIVDGSVSCYLFTRNHSGALPTGSLSCLGSSAGVSATFENESLVRVPDGKGYCYLYTDWGHTVAVSCVQ